jgi:lambda family phage tail tape measure protein
MSLGSLVLEVSANVARFQSDMGKVAQIAESKARQIDKVMGVVQTSLKALGAGFVMGLTLDKIKGKIEEAISSAAGLQQLAERTGGAVEKLSGLAAVAKLSGTDTDALAVGLQKLSKSLVDARDGGTGSAAAFEAIGISVKDLKGLKPDEAFELIARRMDEYADGAEKTAVAQKLLGKAGANLLPVMRDLAENGALQVKLTSEQARMADAYEKNLKRLTAAENALFKVVGLEVVPVLNAFTKALIESATNVDGVKGAVDDLKKDGSIRAWAEDSARVVGFVVDAFDGVARTAQIAVKSIGATAAAAAAVSHGEFAQAKTIQDEWMKDVDAILNKPLFSARLNAQLAAARNAPAPPKARKPPNYRPNTGGGEGADEAAKKILEGRLKAQEDFISAEKRQLQNREQYVDFYQHLEYTTLRESVEQKQVLITDSLRATLDAYDKEVAAIKVYIDQAKKQTDIEDGKNRLAEVARKRATAEEESAKKQIDVQLKLLEVQRQFDLATQERLRQDGIANAQARFSIDMMGKSTLEVMKAVEARRIQQDLDERIYRLKKLDPNANTSEAIAQAAIQTAQATALIEESYNKQRDAIFGAQEAVRKYAEDAANVGAQVENAMTSAFKGMEDALVTFVTTGKLSFTSLANSIVADITRIIIKQQIMGPLMSWLGGGTSGNNPSAFVGGGDILTSIFGSLFGGGKASGGPVSAGGLYQVNENGPELLRVAGRQYLMMGSQGGSVAPNAGGNSVTVQINQSFAPGTDTRTTQQAAKEAGYAARVAMARNS